MGKRTYSEVEKQIIQTAKSAKKASKNLVKLSEEMGKKHENANQDKIMHHQQTFNNYLEELKEACGKLDELNQCSIEFEETTFKRVFVNRVSFRMSRRRGKRTTKTLAEGTSTDYENDEYNHSSVKRRDIQAGSTRPKSDDALVNDLVNEMEQLKRQNMELQRTTEYRDNEIKHLRDQLKSLTNEKSSYIQQIDGYKAELDDAMTRLSAVASSKLRDKNPNVVDLSDANRPSKIAEQLSELYDNEWTNAYDVLETNKNDRECCETLLGNIMNVYKDCQKFSALDGLYERVQQCILLPAGVGYKPPNTKVALPDLLKQQIKELRRTQAKLALPEVCQVILKRNYDEKNDTMEMYDYLKKCIEICWFMVVQDPPLAFNCGPTTTFDTARFRSYTKRGRHVRFVVWPALLVQEGGALLAKGIAQGYNKESLSTLNDPKQSTHV